MGNLLTFIELLALAFWLGGTGVPRMLGFAGLRIPVALLCALALTLVQVGRGLLWTWSGMTTPACVLFAALSALGLWRPRLISGLAAVAPLLAYSAWIAYRGW
jgi:hypothetical protein